MNKEETADVPDLDDIENISNVCVHPLERFEYVRPVQLLMNLNIFFFKCGWLRTWDAVISHSSVAALIYHRTRQAIVLVKQFRPAVYANSIEISTFGKTEVDTEKFPPGLGMTFELCAGIIEESLSPEETMRKEILEECGFNVPINQLERVTRCKSGTGIIGSEVTYFYAEVDDFMKVSEGGGRSDEGEFLKVVYLPVEFARHLVYDENIQRTPGLLFMTMWFAQNKLDKLLK
ncbi:Uridine diphosphate glucose pyrophosphatase [Trichinella pseudospiralis]|uniref:Uridine diphosphate glucose pyrophosphatase NUDT14 n=1 Tax=Trichinella pseudospiralis TaxID=6337 RepID=A0A0V0YA81_TRIPS|nr:Uridine diphosphate glucose pyrophosphatase [Trichinella pseudospiralis]